MILPVHAILAAALLSADARADMLEKRMTTAEMLRLVDGKFGMSSGSFHKPARALGSAGFIPGVARLGIPDLQETDASLGVADPTDDKGKPVRGAAGYSTALPSQLATAATWNPQLAYETGAMIGGEAHDQGFNVMLAGGADLARDPRNGRNFEYAGEDPLLAGTIAGNSVAGIQSRHIVSTVKHFALNDQETSRGSVNSIVDWAAARESDLLAFEIAIGIGKPGAVMCSYNRVNGVYACDNEYLLTRVLKQDWRYPGFVLSDWGAVHGVDAARAGLDQESAESFDDKPYFGKRLANAVAHGYVPISRLHEMVHRILRSMFAAGVFDDPPMRRPIDAQRDAALAQTDEEQAIVLLKNAHGLLPLSKTVSSIAVIGLHGEGGVLSGGGSSQVWPVGGPAVRPGKIVQGWYFPIWDPSSPLREIRALAPNSRVRFYGGSNPEMAAAYARRANVAIVFAYQWLGEAYDAVSLSLPNRQDALIAKVAAANPNTIVVLETGGPVTMPWLSKTRAVLEAWYPGQAGAKAVARVLFGEVSPSGRLPITFPNDLPELPRSKIDSNIADYRIEGADVGYRWYQLRHKAPLFPFGYGLSYSTFRYSNLSIHAGNPVVASFEITNTGKRKAADIPQLYVALPPSSGERARRLAGWQRVELQPGETRSLNVTVDSRILARFDALANDWHIVPGAYTFMVGFSAADLRLRQAVALAERRFSP